jgi:hypothetical protein
MNKKPAPGPFDDDYIQPGTPMNVKMEYGQVVENPFDSPEVSLDELLSSDSVTHKDVPKKVKPVKEVNPMKRLPGESQKDWAKRVSGVDFKLGSEIEKK